MIKREQVIGGTEIITGQIKPTNEWVDGKQVYVKRIDCGALPNNTTKTVAHGLSLSSARLLKVNGLAYRPSIHDYLPIPAASNNALGIIQLYIYDGGIQITTYSDRSSYTQSHINIYFTYN